MSFLLAVQILFTFSLLVLFVFYALIFVSIRRAEKAAALPMPPVWKLVMLANAIIFAISILIVLLL